MKTSKNIKALLVTARGFMLLIVFAAIVFTVTAIIQETVGMHLMVKQSREPDTRPELTEQQEHDDIIRRAGRTWLPDGTMHLVYSLPTTFFPKGGRQVEIYDTDVNLLWSGSEKELPFAYLSGLENFSALNRYHAMHSEFLIDFSRSYVVPVVSAERKRVENWRYVPSEQYFVGYNRRGDTIGCLGANGFTDDIKKAASLGAFSRATLWVPRDSYTPMLLWQTEKALWQMDFEARRAERLYESKEKILNFELFAWRALEEQDASLTGAILIREKKDCHIVFDDPRQAMKISLPSVYSQINHYVRLLRNKNDFYVQVSGSKGAPVDNLDSVAWGKWFDKTRGKPIDNWYELHRLEEDGSLKLLSRNDWTTPPKPHAAWNTYLKKAREFKKYTTAAAPAFFQPISKWRLEAIAVYRNEQGMIAKAVDDIIIYTAPKSIFYCLLLSLLSVCAAAYHGWARRLSLASLIAWLVFVALFNVAGLLTYLSMNHRPVLKCSTCGKKRHLLADICIRCGAALPLPEKRSTDLIFAG
jgi:hypothetical protein